MTINAYEMACRIHVYVANAISYLMEGGWDDAKTVLQRGTGSCSEYSYSMIALCRAVGLPARFAGGSEPRSLPEGRVDTAHHRWVEVYIPGYAWVPFDPTHDDGSPVKHRETAAQERALVMRRGGGDTGELGWRYMSRATCWPGVSAPGDDVMVWTGLTWNGASDFDGDGVTNAADAFPYDAAASTDSDADGQPNDWHPGYGATNSSSVPLLRVDTDDDNDGLPDEWEVLHGLNSLDESDASGDADGDGFINRDEYVAGTSPTSADECLYVHGTEVDGQVVVEWPCASGRTYRVSVITNGLCVGDWVPRDNVFTAHVNGVAVWTNTLPGGSVFYRIGVE